MLFAAFNAQCQFINEDQNYRNDSVQFEELQLKGDVRSVMVSVYQNLNYYEETSVVKMNPRFNFCKVYVLDNKRLSESYDKINDSIVDRRRVYSNGHIVELVDYLPDGSIKYRCLYTYNSENRPQEMQVLDKAGKVTEVCTSEYAADGKLVSVINSKHYQNYKYIYDESGGYYEIKYVTGETGELAESAHYIIEKGNFKLNFLIKNTLKIPLDSVPFCEGQLYTEKEFDVNGKEIFSGIHHYTEGLELLESYSRMDESAQMKFEWTMNGGDTIALSVYQYENNLLQQKLVERKHKILLTTYNYDKSGNLLSELEEDDSYQQKTVYVYEFDNYKNWTSRKTMVDGKLASVEYRKIEYYPK